MALTPAICEEALFRGPILRGLRTRLPPAGAAILTGLLFGIYHLDPWRLLPTAILGVALSGIALGSDSIVPAMVAHFVNNACLILLARLHADDTDGLPTTTKASPRHARCYRPVARNLPGEARRQDARRYVAYFTNFSLSEPLLMLQPRQNGGGRQGSNWAVA